MKIYLIGLPGVGKTYIGKQLAKDLNIKFIDLDDTIEQKSKLRITEIFANFGQSTFRKMEARELTFLINDSSDFILSTGGGAPCFYNNTTKLISSGLVIWIKSIIPNIIKRIEKDNLNERPLFDNKNDQDIKNTLEKMYKKRVIYYSKAHMHYDADNNSITNLITDIKQWKLTYSKSLL